MNLYEITEEFNKLNEMLSESGGELTEEIENLEFYIQNLLTTKTDGMVYYVNSLEDDIEKADKHIARLQAYKKIRKNAISTLKNYTADCMTKLGKKKLKGEINEISISKPRKVVKITDPDKIPVHLLNTTVNPNLTEIKKVLDLGVEIKGAELVNAKTSVKFKLKSMN